MRIVNDSDTRESLKRGKSFGDLVDEEKVQEFIDNFCHEYSNFYDSNLVNRSWRKKLELSRKFIDYHRECKRNISRDFYKTVLLDPKFRSDLHKTVKAWVMGSLWQGKQAEVIL